MVVGWTEASAAGWRTAGCVSSSRLFTIAPAFPANKTAFDDGKTRLAYSPLAGRVAGAAEELQAITPSPRVIGLLGGNSVDWVVGQLAAWYAGKVVVPLPPFFSVPQLRHVVQDAGISHVLCTSDMVGMARLLGVPFTPVSERQASFVPLSESGGSQIIYTSGSTGQPKGVLAGRRANDMER